MRLFILFCIFGMLGVSMKAQKLYPLREIHDSLAFQIKIEDRKPVIQYTTGNTSFFGNQKDFPALQSISLQGGDLILEYKPRHSSEALSYRMDLQIQTPEGELFTAQAHEFTDEPLSNDLRRIVWMDALEYLPDFTLIYQLKVHRSLMGAVNCEAPRPGFTLKKRLPYYAAAGVGLACLGLGQVYQAQSDDFYKVYQRRWAEGLPEPGSDDPLAAARKKHKDAVYYTWAGIGILSLDIAFYTWKGLKIKKKRKVFDKFCGDATSFQFKPALINGNGLGIALHGTW